MHLHKFMCFVFVSMEAREFWMPWNWSNRGDHLMWVLSTELGFSSRTASTLQPLTPLQKNGMIFS